MLRNKILNIDILSITKTELLNSLVEGVLFTPNVDHLVKLQKDKEFYQAYLEANWIICDSNILNFASKYLKLPFAEVIPGSSFFPSFYNYHKHNKDIRIFLLGSAPGVALQAMENINKKVGWNMVVGAHSPSFGFEKNRDECNKVSTIINESQCNVLVVGLGAPKQEKWIHSYRSQLPYVKLFMALGATIDFESGNIRRAPKIFRKLALEWLYRMLKDPKRLVKRYLIDDIPFFSYIIKQKFGFYTNPFSDSLCESNEIEDSIEHNYTPVVK